MTEPSVLYAEDNGVATITLNRPQARNAIDSSLASALRDALLRAESRTQVHVVVMTGTDPAFCAGLDLKEFTSGRRPPDGASAVILQVSQLRKPSVGAINGPVMTGGLELALGLDVLIASDRARFADTHAKVGILPGGGMTARLPRAVGARLAMDMSYTGRILDADEAERHGLVSRVVPHADLLTVARELAETIASRDPAMLAQLKQLYRHSLDGTAADALGNEIIQREARRALGGQLLPEGAPPGHT